MAKGPTYHIIAHVPETEAGRQELARRAAVIQADSLLSFLHGLSCPADQKIRLLDTMIEDTKKELQEKRRFCALQPQQTGITSSF